MVKIGHGHKHRIPRWVTVAERRFREKYRGATYHGVPMNTETVFTGKRYKYVVTYGDALDMGTSPMTTFYRYRRYGIIKRLIIWIRNRRTK